ncbi:hypothetical protein BGZ99_006682 [Dissophora globulifera]|uniref:Auxin efflux carrier n=1 Tax=Dissophora globulifera TaxID=979702 RepID=A0A9P6UZG1_9FUNG|nr:hypothetical protein BGZ99_006682 [Dissophora globulifera]
MARHGLLTPAAGKGVADLILNYCLPTLLFSKMITAVDVDNVHELGIPALMAVGYICMGGVFGLLIQRTGLVPKRLHWGVVAACMFSNFGDLPISIILAVTDHPPFVVGDGSRGASYTTMFLSIFFVCLYPLGGYRLVKYDHVKETKRLQSLAAALEEESERNNRARGVETLEMSATIGSGTPAGNPASSTPTAGDQKKSMPLSSSPSSSSPAPQYSPLQYLQQDPNGQQSSFSASSTMISVDNSMEESQHTKELRYRPHVSDATSPRDSPRNGDPFHPISYPPQVLRSPDAARFSVDSVASNGSGETRFSTGEEHTSGQPMKSSRADGSSDSSSGKQSLRSPASAVKRNQPSPLHPYESSYGAGGSGPSSTASSHRSQTDSLTPSESAPMTAAAAQKGMKDGAAATVVVLSNTTPSPPSPAVAPLSTLDAPKPAPAPAPPVVLPPVPPMLSNAHRSWNDKSVNLFWKIFHITRENLAPPTIGIILGIIVAVTPIRKLFILTPDPLPSPDELPPLSFILELAVALGGACVPLGLTVTGASLSRIKPGRLRPMIPTITMVTLAKLVISPIIGISFVQLVLVREHGWVNSENHMLRFVLMLQSAPPTNFLILMLTMVWDKRATHAGSEMATLIAFEYLVSLLTLSIASTAMMYFLF